MASLRYTRQVRLADVGPSGQARLEGLRAHVSGSDLSSRVEALYLAGAGVAVVTVEAEGIAEAVRGIQPGIGVEVAGASARAGAGMRTGESLGELHSGAAEVAEGALRALFAIRGALFESKDNEGTSH